MRLRKSIFIAIIAINAFLAPANLFAQDSILVQATTMWQKNDREGAFLLLDKALFVLGDSAGWIYGVEKAKLCMAQNNFKRAAQLWENATDYAPTPQDFTEILFLQLYCFIKTGDTSSFFNVYHDISDEYIIKKVQYATLHLIQSGRIDSARHLYTNIFGNALSSEFRFCKKAMKKSTTKAMIMSAILPGAGQAYIGDWKDGLNSLALNTVMMALTYSTVVTYTPVDGVLLMSPWLLRYYAGGIKNLKLKNKQHQEKAIQELQLAILKAGSSTSVK